MDDVEILVKVENSKVVFNAVETMLFEFRLILNDPEIALSEKAAVMECLDMLVATMGIGTKYVSYRLKSEVLEDELTRLGYCVDYESEVNKTPSQ